MREPPTPTLHSLLERHATAFGRLWQVPDLASTVQFTVSPRLTRSLGITQPGRRRITLADSLAGDPDLLREVLCHELAHVVATELVGRTEPPHGPTWARLVEQAGYRANRAIATKTTNSPIQAASKTGFTRYLHECQVCDFQRLGRRRVTGWRCADCRQAGLPGLLRITKLDASK